MSEDAVLEVRHLSKRYSGRTAVDDISFQIGKGEIVAFLGPNGAGKSTTMRIITTFQPATSGTVRVAGHDVFRSPQAVQRSLGYMPENNPLPLEMRVTEYLRFRARLKGLRDRARIADVLEACGLADVDRRIIGQLSRGYRQRVGLAEALLHEPALLILDEPTSGLDPNQIRSVRDLIRSLAPKMTVLLSTHILSEAALTCDRVIILHHGRILADDTTAALQKQFRQFSEIIVELKGAEPNTTGAALEALDETQVVRHTKQDDGFVEYVVRCHGAIDLRPAIFKLAHAQGWELRELRQREYPLEEIFAHLTQQSAA